MDQDKSYFTRREAEEHAAADRAKGPARDVHSELAKRYHDLAEPEQQRKAAAAPSPA